MVLKLLVNASGCSQGGGAQVAANFILAAQNDPDFQLRAVASPEVARHLRALGGEIAGLNIADRIISPVSGLKTRALLKSMDLAFHPDAVFTVFGPAYCSFSARHICGYAQGWDTHPSALALSLLTPTQRLLLKTKSFLRLKSLRRTDYYWTETEVSKLGLATRGGIPADRIAVIPNGHSNAFEHYSFSRKPRSPSIYNILVLCAPYVHKRLGFAVETAAILKKTNPDLRFQLNVTVPPGTKMERDFLQVVQRYSMNDYVTNLGVLDTVQCCDAFENASCLFLPTALETFSVTYLEAMKALTPIVTTNLDFAQDTCGDAALYFNPTERHHAAALIARLLTDYELQHSLAEKGLLRQQAFPSPTEKYKMHKEWIYEVCAHRRDVQEPTNHFCSIPTSH